MTTETAKTAPTDKSEETPTAPPAGPAAAASPPVNLNMPIQLVLTVNQINIALKGLAKLPLEESIDTFQVLKGQGDMAIAVSQGIAAKGMDVVKPNGSQPAARRRKTH